MRHTMPISEMIYSALHKTWLYLDNREGEMVRLLLRETIETICVTGAQRQHAITISFSAYELYADTGTPCA